MHEQFDGIARELWSHNASWWQEGFTDGADPEYREQILPLIAKWTEASEKILEVGTGEGQVLRHLLQGRDRTLLFGIDPTREQVELAFKRGGPIRYAVAEARAIPLGNSGFDTVVACLVFEHINDLEPALSEVRRMLVSGGRFLLLLNHPLFQTPESGWIDDQSFGDQYWRIGKYLERKIVVEEVEKDVFIPFVHRPLSDYINTASIHGLRLMEMQEPAPPQGFLDLAPEYYEARFVPRLLGLLFEAL